MLGMSAAGLALVVTAGVLKSIYVDYLWFQSVGFEQVFQTRITTQVLLFVIGMATAAMVIGGSVRFAWRAAPRRHEESFIPQLDVRVIRRLGGLALTVVVLLLSVMLGGVASGAWDTVLQWRHAVPFGAVDPQFGRDVSFFVFLVPALRAAARLVRRPGGRLDIRVRRRLRSDVCPPALPVGGDHGHAHAPVAPRRRPDAAHRRGDLSGTYGFVSSSSGLVHGGMYTDINARLPMRYVIAGLAALAGIATMANPFLTRQGFRLPALALGAWGLGSIAGGGIYPSLVQSLQVAPNELRREEPYIQRNVDATRRAWGLDRIDAVSHPADPTVSAAELGANPETLENIRLLDPLPLTATLNELQALRPLYRFGNIDISRYPLREREAAADQQVLISARELDLARVADRNWTRDRLQLTHGFGAIATPVTEVQSEGLPRLTLRDIPPRSDHSRLGLSEDGARVYFGELTSHYVIVNSHEPEFDYPDPQADGRDVRTSYSHDRGIVLSSLFRRALLAWELRDLNVLISGQIHNESRLLLYRQIQERARKVAPFLRLDSDPYVAIIDGGLKWIQPAYTASSRYPYSQPDNGINYVRNSVQIVIDASTGDMELLPRRQRGPGRADDEPGVSRPLRPGRGDAGRGQAAAPLPTGHVPGSGRTVPPVPRHVG